MQNAMLFLSFGVVLVTSGSSVAHAQGSQPAQMAAAVDAVREYTLSPGDKVKITVFNVPEITGEFSISPTGDIALPLVGDFHASGLSVDRLTLEVSRKLASGYVNNPKVTIEVTNFRPFYILGEVNHPGEFPYKATMTLDQAIATAGGYTYRASHHSAYVRRAGGEEKLVKFGEKPIYILPGDTIRIGARYF